MKLAFLSLMVSSITLFSSCKKDNTPTEPDYVCTGCAKTPEAQSANDNSSKGIYKGTFIGSSGTIKFDLANNGSAITAVMVIDGTTVNLTANVTWQAGQAYVSPFTGTLNGQPVSITFSVGATGANPTVTSSSIPGHPNVAFTIIKETSSSLVEAFEGTYNKPSSSGPETGIFNLIVAKPLNKVSIIGKKNGSSSVGSPLNGSYSNGSLLVDFGNGNKVTGTVIGDKVTGNIIDQHGTGNYTGKRTL